MRDGTFLDFLDGFRYGAPQFPTRHSQNPKEGLVRKSAWLLILFILLGGLLGGILGEILRVTAPKGAIQNMFTTALTPGINPPLTLDLVLIKITFGIVLKMNLL